MQRLLIIFFIIFAEIYFKILFEIIFYVYGNPTSLFLIKKVPQNQLTWFVQLGFSSKLRFIWPITNGKIIHIK